MKLEFEQNIIPDGLYKELGFDAFMRLFDLDIPLLPRRILRPLSAQKGREHFRILQDLQKQVDQKKLELEKLSIKAENYHYLILFFPSSKINLWSSFIFIVSVNLYLKTWSFKRSKWGILFCRNQGNAAEK